MSWKTAISAWGLVTKLFSDACGAKEAELCVREDNPAIGVRGPDCGPERAGPYLFPDEFLKLVAYEGVSLNRRRIHTLAVYLYLRGGELAALEWADIHVDHGYVSVHRALNTDTGKIKSTKTGRVRKVPIEPSASPSLGGHAGGSGRRHRYGPCGRDARVLRLGCRVASPPPHGWRQSGRPLRR